MNEKKNDNSAWSFNYKKDVEKSQHLSCSESIRDRRRKKNAGDINVSNVIIFHNEATLTTSLISNNDNSVQSATKIWSLHTELNLNCRKIQFKIIPRYIISNSWRFCCLNMQLCSWFFNRIKKSNKLNATTFKRKEKNVRMFFSYIGHSLLLLTLTFPLTWINFISNDAPFKFFVFWFHDYSTFYFEISTKLILHLISPHDDTNKVDPRKNLIDSPNGEEINEIFAIDSINRTHSVSSFIGIDKCTFSVDSDFTFQVNVFSKLINNLFKIMLDAQIKLATSFSSMRRGNCVEWKQVNSTFSTCLLDSLEFVNWT